MKPPCPTCGHVHPSNAARVVSRYVHPLPPFYRADIPDAPYRTTREAAERDWCDYMAAMRQRMSSALRAVNGEAS